MIDIDKLICDFMSFECKAGEFNPFKHLSSREVITARTAGLLIGKALKNALKAQNLEFKDGELVPIEEEKPWSIEDAKDGEILYLKENDEDSFSWLIIFKSIKEKYIFDYCSYCLDTSALFPDLDGNWGSIKSIKDSRLATEEEKQLLMGKMQENGYSWNAINRKIQKISHEENNPIPNIDSMVEAYKKRIMNGEFAFTANDLVEAAIRDYRNGLEDMYRRLKSE